MDMKIVCLVLLVLVLTIAQDPKLEQMRLSTDSGGILDMDWSTFKKYVIDGPRNYTTVVFFTSETSQEVQCPFCPILKRELETVLDWYRQSVPVSQRDLFFVSADYGKNKEVYQNYYTKIQTMPALVRIPPTTKKNAQFKFQDTDKFPLTSDLSAASLTEYLNRIGDTKVKAPVPSYLLYYILFTVVVLLLIFNIYRYYHKSTFWLCCVLLVVWFSYTGTFFNMNVSPPFIYVHPTSNQIIIFWPSQQMQTRLEGLIMATLNLTLGLSFAFLGHWVPTVKNRRRLYFWLLVSFISIIGYGFYQIWSIKSPWYMTYQ